MNVGIIVLIIVAAMGVSAGAFFILRVMKKKRQVQAMSPEQRELYEAEKEYEALVGEAEKGHQKTVKEWDRHVADMERELQRANAIGSKPTGAYKGVKLYNDRIVTPQGTAYFEKEAVSAIADTAGNIAMTQRITLTRLVAGGIIGGLIFPKKKTHDSRELYLLVQAERFGSVTDCDPDHGQKVRQFAMSINNATQHAQSFWESKERTIADAQVKLEAAKANRERGLEEAGQKLQATKGKIQRVESARQAIDSKQSP